MNIKSLIKDHPILSYFVLAYLFAWGGIFILLGPGGLSPASTRPMGLVLLVFLAMLAGPSLTGIVLTAVLDGRAGLRELWSRWLHWNLPLPRYAVALFTTPVLLLGIGYCLSLLSPVFIPGLIASSDKATLLGFGLVIGLLAGFFEEIGWTGFALPRMLSRLGVWRTGLVLGLIWGAWHVLADYWGNAGPNGSLYVWRGLLWVVTLTAYRILMVQVYHKAPSLGLMQLMHASFTGGQAIFGPALSPADYLAWYGTFSAVLWLLVAILAIRQQRAPGRPD